MNKKLRTATLIACLFLSLLACGKEKRAIGNEENNALKQLHTQIEELLIERDSSLHRQYEEQWKRKKLILDDKEMRFYTKVFGDEPEDGRAMYISMHGGGGTTSTANNQQWNNQKILYSPAEGVYFVPRAPTDTWDLWHLGHIDPLFERAILLAMIYENVNPNKVYIMGYSAGGDGTYQLAPRMSEIWAAAAMSAGHPGDSEHRNLRNLPFAIYMGGEDTPYDRNIEAQKYGDRLAELQAEDPQGYIYDLNIYEGMGHWMERRDTTSLSWMSKYKRNVIPSRVVWIQDNVVRANSYWLSTNIQNANNDDLIIANYTKDGIITIEESSVSEFSIGLRDDMMDLDKEVVVIKGGKEIFRGIVGRSLEVAKMDIEALRDRDLIFYSRLLISEDKVTDLSK